MIGRTLVLIKPDGVKRGLVGEIIKRFEQRGLKIVAMKMVWVDEEFASKHYPKEMMNILGKKSKQSFDKMGIDFPTTEEDMGKKVWKNLVKYITAGPVVAMVIEGVNAVDVVRKIVGSTDPLEALPGTIRGDFAHQNITYVNVNGKQLRNLIHASDSVESAKKEIKLWFNDNEIYSYKTDYEENVF